MTTPSSASAGRRALVVALVVIVTAGLGLAVLLTRTGPVDVALPPMADDPACQAVGRLWPTEIAGRDTRDTDPASTAASAWGDPPVIARCGLPALGPTTDQCISIDGIDWVAQDLSDGTRLTTFGRDPAIEVLVPKESKADASTLAAFAPAAKKIAQGERRCS